MPYTKTALSFRLCLSASAPSPPSSTGTINGALVDQTGAAIARAAIETSGQRTSSGTDGHFSLPDVAAGPFQITITAQGFAPQSSFGTLHAGETLNLPQIILAVARLITDVPVTLTQPELAKEQIKVEEKQRLLAFIPNFNVTYLPHPAPLTPKQKFELVWKTTTDPFTFFVNGIIAGVQQSTNDFGGYGQGAQGYAKRYGASYANFLTGSLLSDAILPSLLKQDPRYYFKGTGTKRSRLLYALSRSVICQGDNGHPQVAYSRVFGELASSGISNLYYPAKDRNGASLTFENALIGIGAEAAANLFQEFLARRLTPKSAHLH